MEKKTVIALLRRRCEDAGGQAAWARAAGCAPGYVSDTLVGRRDPGCAILRALGLVRVVTYRREGAKHG